MKRNLVGGLIMAFWLACVPATAKNIDSVTLLSGDYVGVGSIDMTKLAQRRIYTYLMNFFQTDEGAKQALDDIRASGIVLEKMLTRVVVGLPSDVEKSEHIIIWETSEDLSKYKKIVSSHTQAIDTRSYEDIEYYATRRENECIVVFDNFVVLGSELRVKEVIAAYKNGYKDGPKNPGIKSELKRVNKALDAWFVFSLSDKEKNALAKMDPLIDRSNEGLGVLKLSEMQKGNIAFDFSKGLNVKTTIEMISDESAENCSKLMNTVIGGIGNNVDVKELGFADYLSDISFKAKKSDVGIVLDYDQTKFDSLIALVTQLMKSVSGSATDKKAVPQK